MEAVRSEADTRDIDLEEYAFDPNRLAFVPREEQPDVQDIDEATG